MPPIKLFYSIIRSFFQLLHGSVVVLKTKTPRVSIFGGSRLHATTGYYQQAHDLAHALALKKITIITGGGSGIMQAANCGASHTEAANLGIGITSLRGYEKNPCCQKYIELDDFFTRQHLLIFYSDAFIIFPGGFGTADELANLLNLTTVHHLDKKPIFLVGSSYWQPLLEWFKSQLVPIGEISTNDIALLQLVDSNQEIIESIFKTLHIN
jgi:uncharacterized protein (TIGR00730 family)